MSAMTKSTLLGGLTPAHFLRDYWHKKPLLIRQAIPGFRPPLDREALFELASGNDVESRLVTHFDRKWEMQHGPFQALPPQSRNEWTLLVQGVNLHDDEADALMNRFRFLPDARLDDLMISYATDGGGVGPHFDSYDVFLLQAHGQRRWRIGAQQDLTLVDGMPLKILRDFQPEEEFILEPGDMLYLPPHYAHDGIAIGECITCSIGFRAPAWQEIGEAFLAFMADSIDLPGRYADADLKPTAHPAEIGSAMVDRFAEELEKVRFTREDVAIFVGEYLSEPKPSVFIEAPEVPMSVPKFLQLAKKHGVALHRKTRMLYRGKHVFVNGESFVAGRADKPVLVALADHRLLEGDEVAAASKDVEEALYDWYQEGWLVPRAPGTKGK
jgi:50S ribosomal protein L16 3-hydroxylase